MNDAIPDPSGTAKTPPDVASSAIIATPAESYAGDVSPGETWHTLMRDGTACLVDVRTRAEWTFVGTPDLAEIGRAAQFAEWQSFPGGAANADFLTSLDTIAADRSAPVFFLCRSGARSAAAAIAATQAGYRMAFNVADGFEGPCDAQGHRGGVAGWKAEGLAWRQS